MAASFDTSFDPQWGEAVSVGLDDLPLWRITARNSGPFTFRGTNTYLLGEHAVTLVDPGPLDDAHQNAIEQALAGRELAQIVVTHTHVDHSPLATKMAKRFGVPLLGCAPHHAARDLAMGEINALDASADRDYAPDRVLSHGEGVETEIGDLQVIATPGHTANHLCFALDGTGILFSGDHVMAWATSIVAPPDGAMADYMASLDTLLTRDDTLYLPGHGGAVQDPQRFVRGLRAHRRMRKTAILARLERGDRTIPEIVASIYTDTDPRLHGAAGLSVFAHLEELIKTGLARTEDRSPPRLNGRYEPV